MKKYLLILMLLSTFIIVGCQSTEKKYDECIDACGAGMSPAAKYNNPSYQQCINICVQKYK